jgi:hypothetical protein
MQDFIFASKNCLLLHSAISQANEGNNNSRYQVNYADIDRF